LQFIPWCITFCKKQASVLSEEANTQQMIMQRPGRGSAANLPTTYYGGASVGYGGGGGGASSSSTKDDGNAPGSSISSNGGSKKNNGSAGGGGSTAAHKKPQRRHGSFSFDNVLSQLRNPGSWGYILAAIFLLVLLSDRSGQQRKRVDARAAMTAVQQQRESLQQQFDISRESQRVLIGLKSELERSNRQLQQEIDAYKTQQQEQQQRGGKNEEPHNDRKKQPRGVKTLEEEQQQERDSPERPAGTNRMIMVMKRW
jgi:hypothetical protein